MLSSSLHIPEQGQQSHPEQPAQFPPSQGTVVRDLPPPSNSALASSTPPLHDSTTPSDGNSNDAMTPSVLGPVVVSPEEQLPHVHNIGGLPTNFPTVVHGVESSSKDVSSSAPSGLQPSHKSVATLSSPWQYDESTAVCVSCSAEFNPLNRRHHCRLCGQIFCHDCSRQKALIPPSSIVLVPRGGKKAKPPTGVDASFSPDPDPDRMLTYLSGGDANELLYGKGLEERFKLAREPLRVCRPCFQQLAPLQEDLRASNSNAMRFNHIDPTDPRRFFNSPLAHTLGHEIRKAAYTLNNLLPQPRRRLGAFTAHNNAVEADWQNCKDDCVGLSPNLGDFDGVRIPARLLQQARGIAVITVLKGGFGLAGCEFGTGLVVARQGPSGEHQHPPTAANAAMASSVSTTHRWSAPSAIGTAGMSWGALVGAQVSDHVFLLMTDEAVQMMFSDKSVQLGADVGVAVGPLGRALEGNLGTNVQATAPIYTYSQSKGFYIGASLDGKLLVTRHDVNEKFYGRAVTGMEILQGAVPLPPAAQPLYEALARCQVYAGRYQQEQAAQHALTASNPAWQQQPPNSSTLWMAPHEPRTQVPYMDESDGVLVAHEYGEYPPMGSSAPLPEGYYSSQQQQPPVPPMGGMGASHMSDITTDDGTAAVVQSL